MIRGIYADVGVAADCKEEREPQKVGREWRADSDFGRRELRRDDVPIDVGTRNSDDTAFGNGRRSVCCSTGQANHQIVGKGSVRRTQARRALSVKIVVSLARRRGSTQGGAVVQAGRRPDWPAKRSSCLCDSRVLYSTGGNPEVCDDTDLAARDADERQTSEKGKGICRCLALEANLVRRLLRTFLVRPRRIGATTPATPCHALRHAPRRS